MGSDRPYPSLDEIYQDVNQFVRNHSDIAQIESLGVSDEGRAVNAVYVTDNSVPIAEKEVVLIVCGRHGQELGTRVVGPALLDWLSSREGEKTRRNQLVIIIPVANPDGCVREEFWAPKDKLSETENRTILALAQAYQPDAVMDIHSWGSWHDGEAIVIANTSSSGEDIFIHESLAGKMVKNAAMEGFPFLVHRTSLSHYNNFFCGMCYENFHSVVFGMEVNHASLESHECAKSGTAILKTLLNEGNTRSPWESCIGYPNRILLGDLFSSIRATGNNAVERRKSRSEIWRNRKLLSIPKREFLPPSMIRVVTEYSGKDISSDLALVCRVRGFPELKAVRLNGKEVEGTIYTDDCSTFVSVDITPSRKTRYELSIAF